MKPKASFSPKLLTFVRNPEMSVSCLKCHLWTITGPWARAGDRKLFARSKKHVYCLVLIRVAEGLLRGCWGVPEGLELIGLAAWIKAFLTIESHEKKADVKRPNEFCAWCNQAVIFCCLLGLGKGRAAATASRNSSVKPSLEDTWSYIGAMSWSEYLRIQSADLENIRLNVISLTIWHNDNMTSCLGFNHVFNQKNVKLTMTIWHNDTQRQHRAVTFWAFLSHGSSLWLRNVAEFSCSSKEHWWLFLGGAKFPSISSIEFLKTWFANIINI